MAKTAISRSAKSKKQSSPSSTWFKRQGKGHLTRMSKVLRAYYLANRKKAS